MTKVLVLYYSAYGHIATMAQAAADGARAAGAEVTVLRVPETLDGATAQAAGIVPDPAPVAAPADLERFDAILFGTPTHFGTMAGQMKAFIDSCGGLWARDALVGKVAGVFTASQSQHGGQEHTLLSTQAALLHLGFVIVGLPYTFKGQTRMDEITGGSPYGATTLTGAADGGSRPPSVTELDGARFQGRHIAETAAALAAGRRARARDAA